MGCDIHFTLFARKLSNGKKIDLRFKNYKNVISKDGFGETVWFEDNKKCYSKYHHLFEDFIDGRSYFLFGILSGVRSSEYYEDSRYRRYISIDSDKFKGLKELGFLTWIGFSAIVALTQSGTILLSAKSPPPITFPALQVDTALSNSLKNDLT